MLFLTFGYTKNGSVVKNPPANAGDFSLIPGLGRVPGGGNGNLLQYSCLKNPMDRGAWWATGNRVAELDMTEQLSAHTCVMSGQQDFLKFSFFVLH